MPDLDKYAKYRKTKKAPTTPIRDYAAMVVRGAGGFAPGGPIGALVGGGTELLGQIIDTDDFNLAKVATSAGLGAVPFGKAASLGRSAVKGASLGAGSRAVEQQAEEGLHIPTGEDIGEIAVSGALGAAGGGIAHKLLNRIDMSKYEKFKKVSTSETKSSNVADDLISEAAETRTNPKPYLPRDLQGAKPRYNVGKDVYVPEFDNDVDRALFIVAQKNPSKREAAYIDFLKKHMGLTEREIRMEALAVKQRIKGLASESAPGKLNVPRIWQGEYQNLKPKRAGMIMTERVDPKTGEVLSDGAPPIKPPDEVKGPELPEQPKSEDIGIVRRGLAEARSAQTTLDLSAPLRQGITNITRKEFWTALRPMINAAKSREGFVAEMDQIAARPTFKAMRKAGVEFTDLTKDLTHREENLRGVFVGSLPGIKNSNQAYTVFLNRLRADTFDRMYKDAARAGVDVGDEANLNAIARFINDTTGRGNLGRWEGSSLVLNDVFFAPKLIASRLRMLQRAGDGILREISQSRGAALTEGADPILSKQIRREAIRSMLGVGGLAMAAITLSKANGAKATEDPRSTDFGKLKIGNTRIDYTGGFQQYVRVASQLASGIANVEGDLQERNRADTALRFMRNKLSPLVGSIWNLMSGKNVIGEEVTPEGEIMKMVTPLIINDIAEVVREGTTTEATIAVPSTFFGASVQSYPGRRKKLTMPEIELDLPQMGFR